MKEISNDKTIGKDNVKEKFDFDEKQNLLGFFNKLLEIDMRNNPEKYKSKKPNNPKKKND